MCAGSDGRLRRCLHRRAQRYLPPASNAEPVAGAAALVSPLEVKVKLIAAAGRTSKDSTAASATSQGLRRVFKRVPWRMGWVADGGKRPNGRVAPVALIPRCAILCSTLSSFPKSACSSQRGVNSTRSARSVLIYPPMLDQNRASNEPSRRNVVRQCLRRRQCHRPFGSGGELSKQEAQDLACYIDRQARPSGSGLTMQVSATGKIDAAK